VKRLEKQVEECEKQIEILDKQVAQTLKMLSTPEGAANLALVQLHQKSKKDLNDQMEAWEKATLDLEALKAQAE